MSPRPSPRGEHRPLTSRLALPGVVALAFALRAAALRWGLPDATHAFSYHPDEFDIAGRAIRILNTGNWDPEFFGYGSLPLYLTAIVAWPFHALGLVQTVAGTHLIARLISAAAGAATALVAARLARRVAGPNAALFAAVAVAVAPGHVLHSGFGTVDAAGTLLVALALLAALRGAESGEARPAIEGGALAGLAMGAKIPLGIVLAVPLLAAALPARSVARGARVRHAALVLPAAVLAYLASTPFALVTPRRFLADVRYELLVHPREGHLDVFTATGHGWSHHLLVNLPYVLGVPLLVLALLGIARWIARPRRDAMLLLAFAVPYFAGLASSQVRFLRYTLPLVPVLAVAAAAAARDLAGARPRATRAGSIILVAAALGYAAALTLVQTVARFAPDPRDRAAEWIAANAPPGATIGFASIPWFQTPPITPWNGGERSLPRFNAQPSIWRFVVCRDWDAGTLSRERPYLFVMSEFEWRDAERLHDPRAAAFLAALDRDYLPAARFRSVGPGTRRLFGTSFAPHDWLYPFAEVRVWRRRS